MSLSLTGREVAWPEIICSSFGHMSTEKVLLRAANLSSGLQSNKREGELLLETKNHYFIFTRDASLLRLTAYLLAAYIAASSSTVS